MLNQPTTQDVEIPCKTFCKTRCISNVKLCANPIKKASLCAKRHLFPHFFTHKSQTFTQATHPYILTILSTFPRTLLLQLQII